jgi:hypothetical protein
MADPTESRGDVQPSSSSGGIERLYAEQTVNPAQSSEKPWKSNVEYFQRYVMVSCGWLRRVY